MASLIKLNFLAVLILLECKASTIQALKIRQAPLSLLIPVNAVAEFTCEIQCAQSCVVYWIINGSSTAHQHQRDLFEKKGFTFFPYRNTGSNIYESRLEATATASINNTFVCCLVLDGDSPQSIKTNQASLRVISEPPLIPNPSVTLINETSALLEWSPSFLWPGQHIEYFNVSVTNIDGNWSISYGKIPASFGDVVVSLTADNLDYYERQTCFEYVFVISAFSDSLADLATFNVTGQYKASLGNISEEAISINSTVFFFSNTTPLIFVEIHFPETLCVYQYVTYSIEVEDTTDGDLALMGPYSHKGPGIISHNIVGIFKKDYNYSMRVLIGSVDEVIKSRTHFFNTNFNPASLDTCIHTTKVLLENEAIFRYKVAMGICLFIAAVILSTFVVGVLCMFVDRNKIRLQKINRSRHTIKIMVDNPVYEGPMYETIQQPSSSSQMLAPMHSDTAPTSSLTQNNCKAAHYVDQALICNTKQHRGDIHIRSSHAEKDTVHSHVENEM